MIRLMMVSVLYWKNIVFVESRERVRISLLVLPTGITAFKVLISLLHCQALKDKVWKNIVK